MRHGRVEVQEAMVNAQIGAVMATTINTTRNPMRHHVHDVFSDAVLLLFCSIASAFRLVLSPQLCFLESILFSLLNVHTHGP